MRFRFRRGTALVAQVLKQFDRAVEDLATAQEQIQAQRAKKDTAFQATKEWFEAHQRQVAAEDRQLLKAHQRAEKVRANLTALIGGN
jgi:septation ring formation regulator EzrA